MARRAVVSQGRPRPRRSFHEWGAAIEALGALVITRCTLLVVPFRWVAVRLGQPMALTGPTLTARQNESAGRVEWALAAAASRLPWTSTCFVRAIAATVMLRRRGVPSTIYLGVATQAGGTALDAHAWVRCGTRIVTGAAEACRYEVIATFASGPPAAK